LVTDPRVLRACILLALLSSVAIFGEEQRRRIFIVQDTIGGGLCGYTSEEKFETAPSDNGDVGFLAVVEFVSGRPISILVQRDSEDTSTYDEYKLDQRGNILQLNRSLDHLSTRVRRDQEWAIGRGRATKVSEQWMEYKTKKPIKPDNRLKDLFDFRIILRLSDFPFYPFIVDKNSESWVGGKRCVPGSFLKLGGPRV
jgi:hypothetical protein